MRKTGCLLLVLGLLGGCSSGQNRVERIHEDGIEVVLNRTESVRLKDQPQVFSLQKEFVIDPEDDAMAELGLTDIGGYFDSDSEGNIYLVSPKNEEGYIFQFDAGGRFIRSFGRKGQGPGELQCFGFPGLITGVDEDGSLFVCNGTRDKLVFYSSSGEMIREVKVPPRTAFALPVGNGLFAVFKIMSDFGDKMLSQGPLTITDAEFNDLRDLDRHEFSNPVTGNELVATYHIFAYSLSPGLIFTGFPDKGYEIRAFDRAGNSMRKIRKEYEAVPVSEEYKSEYMEIWGGPVLEIIRDKIRFPDVLPPYHAFISDEEGQLFVMTYEKASEPGAYVYDIFSSDGVFFARTDLKAYHDENGLYAKIKNGRFFSLVEKDSGFRQLEVSRIVWK